MLFSTVLKSRVPPVRLLEGRVYRSLWAWWMQRSLPAAAFLCTLYFLFNCILGPDANVTGVIILFSGSKVQILSLDTHGLSSMLGNHILEPFKLPFSMFWRQDSVILCNIMKIKSVKDEAALKPTKTNYFLVYYS